MVSIAIRRTIVPIILAILVSADAAAWGEAGHRIIARIAEWRLTPRAHEAIRSLVGELSLADIANWADSLRSSRPCTAPWHYIDIPIGDSAFDPARDCIPCTSPGGVPDSLGCIVAAIERFAAELADTSRPRPSRVEALRFLVHLVGDIHQPLHAADNHDRGGNGVIVTFHGQRLNPYGRGNRPWNLHAVWDAGMIDHELATTMEGDEDAYVTMFKPWILARDTAALAGGTPIDWARESHAIADSVIYRDRSEGRSTDIGDDYERQVYAVVEGQLARAGLRLAAMLNRIFP